MAVASIRRGILRMQKALHDRLLDMPGGDYEEAGAYGQTVRKAESRGRTEGWVGVVGCVGQAVGWDDVIGRGLTRRLARRIRRKR